MLSPNKLLGYKEKKPVLKKVLFDEYGGFADKRIKNLEKGSLFIIDDRSEHDVGANKQLYSYFCMIFAEVQNNESVKVTLRGNIPMSAEVEHWIESSEAFYEYRFAQAVLVFSIERGEQLLLGELASAFRNIVAPSARYLTPNYKYVCPRTASSLARLNSVLDKHWVA